MLRRSRFCRRSHTYSQLLRYLGMTEAMQSYAIGISLLTLELMVTLEVGRSLPWFPYTLQTFHRRGSWGGRHKIQEHCEYYKYQSLHQLRTTTSSQNDFSLYISITEYSCPYASASSPWISWIFFKFSSRIISDRPLQYTWRHIIPVQIIRLACARPRNKISLYICGCLMKPLRDHVKVDQNKHGTLKSTVKGDPFRVPTHRLFASPLEAPLRWLHSCRATGCTILILQSERCRVASNDGHGGVLLFMWTTHTRTAHTSPHRIPTCRFSLNCSWCLWLHLTWAYRVLY